MIVLKDKGKNSKIYIPRTKITNVTGGNNATDLTDYYTKEEVDELIENVEVDLSNYYTKKEIDNIVENTTIPYLVVNDDFTGYESGDFENVRQAIINKKPYSIYIPFVLGGYLTPNAVDTFGGQITLTYVYHTNGTTMYYGICYLQTDNVKNTIESVSYATSEQLSKQGVYGLIVDYNEEYDEYAANGVDFYTLKQAIESGNKLYSIYLPSSDNTYKIAAQEIVVNDNEIRCITIENNGDTQITTNWAIRFDDDYFEMHITKGNSTTINIATQEWIEQQGYLTSIPSEYVTESELDIKLDEIDTKAPHIIVDYDNETYEGDLQGVIDAMKNGEEYFIYATMDTHIYLATQNVVAEDRFAIYWFRLSSSRAQRVGIVFDYNGNFVSKSTTFASIPVDNLTSTSNSSPLSANQGRVLKGLIDTNTTNITNLTNTIGDINNALETIIG